MKKSILSALVAMALVAILGVTASAFTGIDASVTVGGGVLFTLAISMLAPNVLNGVVGTIVYSPIVFSGSYYEEIFNEILYMNRTVEKNLVRFIDNVNTEIILTESNITAVTNPYVETPTISNSLGNMTIGDKTVRPYLYMIYKEFSPKDFMYSRFGKPNTGDTSFPKITDEMARLVIERFGKAESELMERRFWNASTAASQSTVAGLTAGAAQNEVGAAEKAYVAASPTDYINGVVTKLILTYSATNKRFKVAGTTITSSNIEAEYGKVYAALIPKLLQPNYASTVKIFVPYNHLQLIQIANNSATFRDLFTVSGEDYFYCGVKIEFVPLANNVMVAGVSQDLAWICDITDPSAKLEINKLQANSEAMFMKSPYTMETAFVQAQQFVLYVG